MTIDDQYTRYIANAVGSSRLATPYDLDNVMPVPPTVTFGTSANLSGKTLFSILREVRATVTSGSADVVAVSGTFSSADVGKRIVSGSGAIPTASNVTIAAVTDSTHATLSVAATANSTAGLVFSEPSGTFRQMAGMPIQGHSTNGIAGTFAYPSANPSLYIPAQWSFGFVIRNATQFSIYSYSHITDPKKYRISVDRGFGFESVSADAITLTATSSTVLTTVNFGALTPFATVRVEVHQDSPGIQGIYLLTTEVTAGATLSPEVPAKSPVMKLAVLADSYHETGYGGATGTKTGWDNPVSVACKLLGFTDIQNRGQGGTGWLNEGKGVRSTNYKARDRVADLAAISPQPDVLFVCLGENDASFTQQAITDEVTYVLGQLKTQLPFCRVYLVGAFGATAITGLDTVNAGIKAAAAANNVPFIDPLTGAVYDRSGTAIFTGTAWMTSTDFTPDGIHPTVAASHKLGHLIADAYVKLNTPA